jgi:hypothetical protein
MLHFQLIILLVGGDVSVDSETLLVTDFVNFKIKSSQFFRYAHSGRVCVGVCVYMFIEMSTHTCITIYVCTVFIKKRTLYMEALQVMLSC